MIFTPLSIGIVHFIGIGGIGMSGIAEIMNNLGYTVQGSDISTNININRLRTHGITIHIGHKAENLGNARVVVISSAIKNDNIEVITARNRLIPVVRRAEMLAELIRLKWAIAVGGTHGKTTATSIIATLLDVAGFDPTVISGGIINAYGTNARIGDSNWVVVEADESDGTFIKLPATIVVITNIDPEHLDFYGSFDNLREAFLTFVENIPFYGFATMCSDHPEVQSLISRVSDRKIITYGLNLQADVRATNIVIDSSGAIYDIIIANRINDTSRTISKVRLPMYGHHNVLNSLPAIAVANELGINDETIRSSLGNFTGVVHRFTKTGESCGIVVIDDYGHHPVEIIAALQAARQITTRNVIAVVQPHRFSRLQRLFNEFCNCFNDADIVIVTDIYSAGEQPIEGINQNSLVNGLIASGHRKVFAISTHAELPILLYELAKSGDLIVCLGAGNISTLANELPAQLNALTTKHSLLES
ncbi:MAG: UDP-N-acetylmuramate--L-alanine ligase [Rhodospirillaceae bacterium]|jgi:UDP-N-acetylmuramate--alanine ligase|nr:UDP-N-acetylmuramate--L-alanine ligase [Rhodospirillaceae bacterium]